MIVDFKNSPTGKLDCSKLKVSLSFDGNVPFNALVNFSEIAGAVDISCVSWSTRFAKINTAKGAKIRMKIIEIKMTAHNLLNPTR